MRDICYMDIKGVFLAQIAPQLSYGLKKRQPLYIAYRPAYFNYGYIGLAFKLKDSLLYLVCHVRDHLDGSAKVIPSSFLGDDAVINAS